MVLPILAGPEIGVASTKAFTCQLAVLACLAIAAGRQRGGLDAEAEERAWSRRSPAAPGLLAQALALEPQVAEIARELARARDVLFLGRGPMYPLALEGALKLKEISYIHAEGYAAGELKHGPIALVDEPRAGDRAGALRRALREDRLEHAGGDGPRRPVLLISDAAGHRARRPGRLAHAGDARDATRFVAPIVYAAPVQLLAYHVGGPEGHRRRPAAQPREVRDGRMTATGRKPDAALAALAAAGDPEKAAEMAAYHKAPRRYLGVSVPAVEALVADWRREASTLPTGSPSPAASGPATSTRRGSPPPSS